MFQQNVAALVSLWQLEHGKEVQAFFLACELTILSRQARFHALPVRQICSWKMSNLFKVARMARQNRALRSRSSDGLSVAWFYMHLPGERGVKRAAKMSADETCGVGLPKETPTHTNSV